MANNYTTYTTANIAAPYSTYVGNGSSGTNWSALGGGGGCGATVTFAPTQIWSSFTDSSGLTVTGTMSADDVMLDGVSLKEVIHKIQDRLAILVPDPAKLEKFAALKNLYDQYKMMEALCTEPDK